MNKKEIGKIVLAVLKEKGLLNNTADKQTSDHPKRAPGMPVVLNVFHAGVRKSDLALEQVGRIEKISARSGVFTMPSARAWVCGADVKEKIGIRCILDTVSPEGLEKALQKADILVLPTFCFQTAAKTASLINHDPETAIVISALMQGKKVLATRDSFTFLDVLRNDGIKKEIERILAKLESFGMVLCNTDELYAAFEKMVIKKSPDDAGDSGITLITAKTVESAVKQKENSIVLAPGGIITPLARDQAKEYAIKIISTKK
ncbi:hypothetical protein QUF90_25485 [Desulfococcaceae bacterium HSG9]|nr:hypothetical protein [Desulfococcaceae bacterium HSG9]